MSVLERAKLEDSTLSDLHAIASELSLDGYRRLRKAQLIDALLERQIGTDAEAATTSDDEDEGDSSTRRRRGRRGGRTRSSAGTRAGAEFDPFDDEVETEEEAAERTSRARQSPGKGRSGRGGRGAKESGDVKDSPSTASEKSTTNGRQSKQGKESKDSEPVLVSGTVELLPGGSGFLRVNGPEPSDDDVYISAAQVKRCELVAGDTVSGPRRPPHRSERFPSLVRIDTVNEKPADEISERARFDDLPAEFPTERFKLGTRDQTLKVIEPLAPFGRGSRVLITGGSWSGKSHLLQLLAGVFAKEATVTTFAALAGVRPEELGEWAQGPVVPAATAPLGSSSDAQDHAVELVVEQAKRLVARGENAVVLIDSLDGLHELTARKVLASARKVKDGGSLTIIATASETFGGETTVIALDENLTRAGNLPAVKFPETGAVRAELLVGDKGAKAIQKAISGAIK